MNVYYFAQSGGFSALRDLFVQEVKPNNIKNFCRALKAVSVISEYLTKEQFKEGIIPVCYAALRNSEQLIDKIDLTLKKPNDLLKHLKLLDKIFSTDCASYSLEISKIFDLIINHSMKLLRSQILSCQIAGIREIINAIKTLKRKWPSNDPKDSDEIKAGILCDYLSRQGIFRYMFTESNVHSELISRFAEGDVSSFLYLRNSLSKEEIKIIYDRAFSKGEDCTMQKYANIALTSLILHFSASSAKELFEKIKEVPLKEFTDSTVKILNVLGKNEFERCVQATTKSEVSEFILQDATGETDIGVRSFIFSNCLETALQKGLSIKIQNALIENFLSLLAEYRNKLSINPQYDYLKIAEKMIIDGESLAQAGKIYTKIINSLISAKHQVEIVNADFFRKIIDNIKKKLLRKTGIIAQEIQLLVDILQILVVNNLHKKLLPEELDLLWEVFVKNNDSETIRSIFFTFINQILSSKIVKEMMAEKALNKFFGKTILSLEPQQYTQSAFTCFKTLFLLINFAEKNLKK